MLDLRAPLRHWSTTPVTSGLYVRDWRGMNVTPEHDRRLHVERFVRVDDRRSVLWPGSWYTMPDRNDSSVERLPWRPLTKDEALSRCPHDGQPLATTGLALQQNYGGVGDFGRDDVITTSPDGTEHLIACAKCPQCGFSRAL